MTAAEDTWVVFHLPACGEPMVPEVKSEPGCPEASA